MARSTLLTTASLAAIASVGLATADRASRNLPICR
jgi:hypothetical protein